MEEKIEEFEALEEAVQSAAEKVEGLAETHRIMRYQWAWSNFTKSVVLSNEKRLWQAINDFALELRSMIRRKATLGEIEDFINLCFEPPEDEEDFLKACGKTMSKLAERAAKQTRT